LYRIRPFSSSAGAALAAWGSQRGIQFFLASHSYFVIKKLYLIASGNNISIPFISLSADSANEPRYDDLANGMPDNSIIDESIRLYKEEMDGALK
jgi:hypothetical protein